MTKQELKSQIEATGATVKSIRQYGSTFKVSINWRDYPLVRHLMSETVKFSF